MKISKERRKEENGIQMYKESITEGVAVAGFSPAAHYESHKLELPGAWEPSDSSEPLPFGGGKAAHHLISHGN
jgi:hypothetical protein